MIATVEQAAPGASLLRPKDSLENKLLNILVSDPKDVKILGVTQDTLLSPPLVTEAGKCDISAHIDDIVAQFPRRFSTVEEFDAATSENRKKFLMSVTFAVLSELFFLAMTISPFNTGGALRAIARTLVSASGQWRFTLVARGLYISALLGFSLKAYFARLISSKEWLTVYKVAIFGMIVELFLTLLVKKLNILAFIARGVIGFYAITLSSLASCNTPEYIPSSATA